MILDEQNEYSKKQALSGAGSVASTNIVDHGSDRDLGVGEPMGVVITVDVAADQADGDETYVAKLQVDSSSAFGSAVDQLSVTIPRTALAGDQFVIPINKDFKFDRFSRILYTLGGTTPSITVSAAMAPLKSIPAYKSYPKGYVIS